MISLIQELKRQSGLLEVAKIKDFKCDELLRKIFAQTLSSKILNFVLLLRLFYLALHHWRISEPKGKP